MLTARYTEQIPPFVGTPTQRQCVDEEAAQRGVSAATVLREALDARYGLVDGRRPETVSRQE